jgi:hypothetical protein
MITEKNFVLNEETGYYCYMPPNDDTKYCLSSALKSESKTMTQLFRDRLHNFYDEFTKIFQEQVQFNQPLDWNWSP